MASLWDGGCVVVRSTTFNAADRWAFSFLFFSFWGLLFVSLSFFFFYKRKGRNRRKKLACASSPSLAVRHHAKEGVKTAKRKIHRALGAIRAKDHTNILHIAHQTSDSAISFHVLIRDRSRADTCHV